MASCITPQWSNSYTPQARLTVTIASETETKVTLDWKIEYVAHNRAALTNNIAKNYKAVINGDTVKSGSYNIHNISTTKTIAEGTKTITKTKSDQKISFSISFDFNLTWSGVYGGTKSASGSITVSKMTSYSVKYDANGGSGAPASQTKWHGTSITLSSSKPTRTGYTFKGWSTGKDTTVEYDAGDKYSDNKSVTLYAVWQALKYTVKYDSNGGTNAPASQTKTYGVALTLTSQKPTRTNYNFKGWGTSAGSTTVAYASGASYTKNASITLYAIWELAYTAPRINDFTVKRCTADGTENDTGTYAKVSCSWETDKAVTGIKIEWKAKLESTWASDDITATGTSGAISHVFGGEINIDMIYEVKLTVADSVNYNYRIGEITSRKRAMEITANRDGAAFLTTAESGFFDVPVIIRTRTNGVTNRYGSRNGTYNHFETDAEKGHYFNKDLHVEGDIFGGENYHQRLAYLSELEDQKDILTKQKVLWSGEKQVDKDDSLVLSEAVYDQNTGIVIISSNYDQETQKASNSQYALHFVPKYFINYSGRGIPLTCINIYGVYAPYVYINNTTITGHERNLIDYTLANGLELKNTKRCIRAVIGV